MQSAQTIEASQHRILIVEDDPVVRKFLRLTIDQSPQLQVIGCAERIEDGRVMLQQKQPDVLLVDLGLPDGSGIALILQARACKKAIECMVITAFDDNQHLFQALQAGATGYLLKDALPDNIGNSILKLLAGESPISPTIARALLTSFCQETRSAAPLLTAREQEVLELMAKGLRRKEIAYHLAISPHTINSHIRRIYHKLEVGSNLDAIRKARQLKVIPSD
ncbi:MAG: response regulator transcription factor [Mariprofundales bacterium]